MIVEQKHNSLVFIIHSLLTHDSTSIKTMALSHNDRVNKFFTKCEDCTKIAPCVTARLDLDKLTI